MAVVLTALIVAAGSVYSALKDNPPAPSQAESNVTQAASPASEKLDTLAIKGRAPKTGYSRQRFGGDWAMADGCDMRNRILVRDLANEELAEDGCIVLTGKLADPYTAEEIEFRRGSGSSSAIQIDHVVALSDAWQKGARSLSEEKRIEFANDPLNLLAVDGPTNVKKGGADAASWLPPNKLYRCRYIARQIAVKAKYLLWVTLAERDAMRHVLQFCPGQQLPVVGP